MKTLSALFVLGIGVTILSGCGSRRQEAQQAAPVPVGVVIARPQSVPLVSNLVGRLSAHRSANVLARVAGVLLTRNYKEGSEVKAGQLLFRIDPAPYKAALDNAKAQLAEAQATYTNAKVNAQRSLALAPKGYISKSALDDALATERTAKAAVQAAQANVETARINLGYTSVRSPIAGRADEQQVTEGALVGQGTATLLTTVDQLNPLYVNFTMSIGELDELRLAERQGGVTLSQPDKVTAKVSLPDGTPFPELATVDFSAPNVDPATGSVNLRAVLPNPKFTLLPGSYVTLQLTMGERHQAFLIPQPALQRDIEGAYVLVVDKDGMVARHNVVTNGMQGADWVVTSGLSAGDQVIASGIQQVAPGGKAKPTPWKPSVAASSAPAPGASFSPPAGE